jgi:hypothetical protein
MKRKQTKDGKQPGPFAALYQAELPALIRLYEKLWEAIADFSSLTDFGEPLDYPVQNEIVGALDMALFSCHSAIKAHKPKDDRKAEERLALLYQHALRFDSTEKERKEILAQALLAVSAAGVKSTVERLGDQDILTVKKGRRVIWQSLRPDKGKRKAAKA